ncbi:hypothetical protein CYMTET_27660, partial [Cymbomonas tetramitiformis]
MLSRAFVTLIVNGLFWLSNGEFSNVPDLEDHMIQDLDGHPCVRLLNLSGPIGCATDKVVRGDVARVHSLSQSWEADRVALLSPDLLAGFLTKVLDEGLVVAGVIVEPTSSVPFSFSPADPFPQSQFAPYSDTEYRWNTNGSGFNMQNFDFPIVILDEDSAKLAAQNAHRNEEDDWAFPRYAVELDYRMNAEGDSAKCLSEATCLPLGGHSVWSAMPRLPEEATSSLPTVLVVARLDTASLFHERALGADAPMSGLLLLLAAADALHLSFAQAGLERSDLAAGDDSVKGLSKKDISAIIELGQVGLGHIDPDSTPTLYVHTQKGQTTTDELVDQLQVGASVVDVAISAASSETPGIPPSSLMALLDDADVDASTCAVITEFDLAYTNPNYHSWLDGPEMLNTTAIAAAATAVARMLFTRVTTETAPEVAQTEVEELVQQLRTCFLTKDPGMTCDLVKSLMTPRTAEADHYIGVI